MKSKYFNYLICTLFILELGIFFICSPRILDDYWFIYQLRPWFESQGINPPIGGGNIIKIEGLWEGIKQVWLYHYMTDNIRLGNIVAPLFLVLPLGIGKLISALLAGYVFFMVFRLAEVDMRRSPLVSLGIVLLIFELPWEENFGVLDFQLNYIWPSAFALWLVQKLWPANDSYSSPGIRNCTVIFFVSFIVGWWHEGIAVPFLVSLVIMSIFFKRCRNPRFLVTEIGLCVGIPILLLSPGMRQRLGGTIQTSTDAFSIDMSDIYKSFGLILLIVCSIILFWSANRESLWKSFKKDTLSVFMLLGSLISLFIMIWTGITGRGGWWGKLTIIILVIRIFNYYYRGYWKSYRGCRIRYLIFTFLILGFVRLGFGDYYAIKTHRLMSDYLKTYNADPDGTVFGEIYESKDINPIAIYLPFERFPNRNLDYIDVYTRKLSEGKKGLTMVIPIALRDITANSGTRVAGDTDLRMKSGYLFKPMDGESIPEIQTVSLIADYGFGKRRHYAIVYCFRSEADEKTYGYIDIFANWFENYLGNLKSVENLETTSGVFDYNNTTEIQFY